jgi:hypothetical protein
MNDELKELIIELHRITKRPIDTSIPIIFNTKRLKQIKDELKEKYGLTPFNQWELNDNKLVVEYGFCPECYGVNKIETNSCSICGYSGKLVNETLDEVAKNYQINKD